MLATVPGEDTRLLINETKPGELDGLKEVKVKIPVRYHMILLSMKVLHGKQISDAVSEALSAYFEKMREGPAAAAAAAVASVPRMDAAPSAPHHSTKL